MSEQFMKKFQKRTTSLLKPLALTSALGLSVATGCGGTMELEESPEQMGTDTSALATFEVYNGSVYAFETDGVSWTAAKAACVARGAGWALATIDNPTEETFLAKYQGSRTWWVGASQRTDGSWGWEIPQDTEGVATRAHFNWGTNQPDNASSAGGDANCVADDAVSGQWGDYNCATAFAYVCEKNYGGDYDGDAKADLILRSQAGDNAFWYMNGTTLKGSSFFTAINDNRWQFAGGADFDRDHNNDLLWRNYVTGENIIWRMTDGRITGYAYLPDESDINWKIVGLGDFDNNNSMDILWRHGTLGQNRIWYMSGTAHQSTVYIRSDSVAASEIVGSGDFNNDGKADILWRLATTGQMRVWLMDNATYLGTITLPTESNLDWKVGGVGAYSGTAPNDIVWYNSATNDVRIWKMRDTSLVSSHFVSKAQAGVWQAMGPR